MNLQLDAYLLEHKRRELLERHNAKLVYSWADEKVTEPNIIKRLRSGIQLIRQIRTIRVHVTFDWKDAPDHLRTNALKTG